MRRYVLEQFPCPSDSAAADAPRMRRNRMYGAYKYVCTMYGEISVQRPDVVLNLQRRRAVSALPSALTAALRISLHFCRGGFGVCMVGGAVVGHTSP